MYLDINISPVPEYLVNAITYCKDKRFAILIGIDSNAHNSAWGYKDNKRGTELLEYLIQEGLLINNFGKNYTYECSTGKSIIDLTLTWNLKTEIDSWNVSNELNHSDSIKYLLTTNTETILEQRQWEKADWKLFTKELDTKELTIRSVITPKRLKTMVDKLYKLINQAVNKACPMQKQITINKNNPWHTDILKQLRKQKFALYKAYARGRTNDENKAKYYAIIKKYKKTV